MAKPTNAGKHINFWVPDDFPLTSAEIKILCLKVMMFFESVKKKDRGFLEYNKDFGVIWDKLDEVYGNDKSE